MKTIIRTFAALILSALAFIPANAASIEVTDAWAPHTGKRTMSAAVYLKIHNKGSADDALIEVKSDVANMTMLHRSYEEDNIMRMDHVETMPVAQGRTAELAPGAYHIMLMGLEAPLKRGEKFNIQLVFEKAGEITVPVDITGIGGPQ